MILWEFCEYVKSVKKIASSVNRCSTNLRVNPWGASGPIQYVACNKIFFRPPFESMMANADSLLTLEYVMPVHMKVGS